MTDHDAAAFPVDFPFRGARDYVHSGSICNFWRGHAPQADGFELVLKHWMAHRLVFTPLGEGQVPAGSGHVAVTDSGRRRLYEITEDTRHPVTKREVYDEDAVPKVVDVAMRSCEVAPMAGFTFFDRVISGNKALINEILDPGVKLIAAKLTCTGFPADDARITLKLKGNVGHRVFKTAILVDGEPNGEVVYYGQ